MSDWTEGYQTGIGYTFGYYAELNPLRLRLALLNAGLAFPKIETACELGFGQGVSINMHAAGSAVAWHGTDFNPSQAATAMEMAQASGANVQLHDQAFADFCRRTDLPDFDFIGLHGIWSWVSDDNRAVIVDFLRRKLKVGGVAYISYNTQPGWAPTVPLRHLLTLHSQRMGSDAQGMPARIDAALAFVNQLMAAEPAFAQSNPTLGGWLQKLNGQNRNYLAHEYFNLDWQPMPFADMAQRLGAAKLSYGGSAYFLDQVDNINLSSQQREQVRQIEDTVLRESVRDFMVNQSFRRDYWVKGPRALKPMEQVELLREQRLILTMPPDKVPRKVQVRRGEANMQEPVYGPILDALATQPVVTLGQVERAVAARGLTHQQVVQSMMVLLGSGAVMPAQTEQEAAQAAPATRRLNSYLCAKARSSADVGCLASPVTGGSVSVGSFHQMFLLAREQGLRTPEEWARFTWQALVAQGALISKDGVTLQTPEENLAEVTERAHSFASGQLPMLKPLGIGD